MNNGLSYKIRLPYTERAVIWKSLNGKFGMVHTKITGVQYNGKEVEEMKGMEYKMYGTRDEIQTYLRDNVSGIEPVFIDTPNAKSFGLREFGAAEAAMEFGWGVL